MFDRDSHPPRRPPRHASRSQHQQARARPPGVRRMVRPISSSALFTLAELTVTTRASRARKLKCDRVKPQCHHCVRRSRRVHGSGLCEYEDVRRRRGPDRVPGARVRTTKPRKTDFDSFEPDASGVRPLQLVFRVSPNQKGKQRARDDDEDDLAERSQEIIELPAEPSYQNARRTWWDDLLAFYSPDRAIAWAPLVLILYIVNAF